MFKNYIIVALRALRRHSGYTLVNVLGLGIGMAACLVIGQYVQSALSYDEFHPDAPHLYRVALDVHVQDLDLQTAYSARPLGAALQRDLPEVEQATRLWYDPIGKTVVRYGARTFAEDRLFYADPSVFDVFGFPLLSGDPRTALEAPNTIVLTESTARKYFGDQNPIGQTLDLREPSDRDVFSYRVTGVMADLPAHTHLDFDFLASYVTQRQSRSESWLGFGVYTYIKTRPDADPAALEAKLPVLFAKYAGPQVLEAYGVSVTQFSEAGNAYRYFLQPVTDIYLHSKLDDEIAPTGDIKLVYLFAAIALFILLLAGINFINLATARSVRRATEVGVRKALGAERPQLVGQFLTESVVLSLLAVGPALVLLGMAQPFLSFLFGSALVDTQMDLYRWGPALLGMALVVGLGAGAYPAFYLSAFRPVAVLKARQGGMHRSRLRNGLVILQFGIATALLVCTAIVYQQTRYMLNKDLGFNKDQVVVIEGAEVMGQRSEPFRNALRGLPNVVRVTNSEQVPGRYLNGSSFKPVGQPDEAFEIMSYTYASFDFVETLGLELVAGRSLNRAYPTDSLAVILNESAVRRLGLEDPVGTQLYWRGESTYTIIGVVRDFHVTSLHRAIEPVALLGPDPRNRNRPNLLVSVRIQPDDVPATLAALGATWKQFAPQEPFVYTFLDDAFAVLYQAEVRTGWLISFFALLAVLIACFGLFGLSAFTTQQRTKEIGIRKILGASVAGIVGLLSKEYLKLVLVAFVVAVPLAWMGIHRWLEGFAYRVSIGWDVFAFSGLVVLLIAFLTVGYQSVKAATANPVSSLRYE